MITFHQIGYLGRLGNQMFQFASTIGIGGKLGIGVKFPIENCTKLEKAGPFIPEKNENMEVKCDLLECFDIDPSYFTELDGMGISSYYQEASFKYDPGILNIRDSMTLIGYFQTEKYFLEHRDLILSQFTFKPQYFKSASDYVQSIRRNNIDKRIVSIHIRRGDYVMYPNHHPVCSKLYYRTAIDLIKSEIPDVKFLIFSDDPEWCKTEFFGEDYIISDLADQYLELCAMSLCDHHIIANSSFSWWGAWLNKNSDKKVIAPSKWFGPAIDHDTSDLYCQNWIKI